MPRIHQAEGRISNEIPNLKTLREAIPPYCFQPSLIRSCSYVVRDLFLMGALSYLTIRIAEAQNWYLLSFVWMSYGLLQGFVFTGIWVLAHECGHHSFSSHKRVNSCIGFVLHSLVLVPFFSWKFTHARHHRYANHMDKDTVFVPHRQSERQKLRLTKIFEQLHDVPGMSFIALLGHQLFGWPMYMLFNISAGSGSLARKILGTPSWECHLRPDSPIYANSEAPFVLLSDIGIFTVLYALKKLSGLYGVWNMLLIYGLPYLWMNHWLIAITYLHHTHPDVPRFEDSSWTFQRGALSTIDRNFGFIGRYFFHGIIDYHVIHHMFSRIPFYHAEEATRAITPLLGNAYIRQDTSFLSDLRSTFYSCIYVKDDGQQTGRMVWSRE